MNVRGPAKLTMVTFRLDPDDKARLDSLVESHRCRAASVGLGSETTATSVLRSLIRAAHPAAPGAKARRSGGVA